MKLMSNFLRYFKTLTTKEKALLCFETFCLLSIFAVLLSLPLFSYREKYNLISLSVSIISGISLLIYCLLAKKALIFNTSLLSVLFFLVYAFLVTLIGTRDFQYIKTIFTISLYSFALFEFYSISKRSKTFIPTYILSMFVFAIFYMLFYRNEIFSLNFNRIGDQFGNVNEIGFYFIIAFSLLCFVAAKKRGFYFFLLLPSLLFAFLAITTGSKKCIFIILITFLMFIYFVFGRKHKILFFVFVLASIGIFIVLLFVPALEPYLGRVKSFFDVFVAGNSNKRDASTMIRISMYIDGFQLWLKNLFFGYGSGGFLAKTNYEMYSHNTIIELLVNFGIIGFALYFYPLFHLLVKNDSKNRTDIALFFIISIGIVSSLSTVLYVNKIFSFFVAYLCSEDFIINQRNKNPMICLRKKFPFLRIANCDGFKIKWRNNNNG